MKIWIVRKKDEDFNENGIKEFRNVRVFNSFKKAKNFVKVICKVEPELTVNFDIVVDEFKVE